jgi:pyridoxal phosphate enzyme (YggS family)
MSETEPARGSALKDNYQRVKDRMAEAAKRCDTILDSIKLVAVTKTADLDQIRELAELGQRDFGENRVQQLLERVPALAEALDAKDASQIQWHMVGHLQRNKVRQVASKVNLVHGVDTLRLAEDLHAYGGKVDKVIDVLLQVNTSGEETKYGVMSPAAVHVARQIDTMVNLRLRGLMTMAPYSDDPEDARPTFARCTDIFGELRNQKIGGAGFDLLSMGMSGDFEVAIEEGANVIRIGRALFTQ